MEQPTLWPLALQALQALGVHYGPAMEEAAAASGLPAPQWYGWLLTALIFEPEPLSTARLRVRAPYTSPRVFDQRLASVAESGFLAVVSEGEYRLTDRSRQAAWRVIEAADAKMAALEPIPPAEMERLATLLYRLVGASLAAPEPPGKWSITYSRNLDRGDDAPVVVRIDQYGGDLAAYRDDAHLAAWQSHQIDGRGWEALTFIWRGDATTLDELTTKLDRHGYTRAEYAEAVSDLLARGWVEEEAGIYRVTPTGRQVRQAAEDLTDAYFYAPWSCLGQDELGQLQDLLVRFRDGVRRLAPERREPS